MAINTFSGGNFINSLEAAGKNKIINGDFSINQRQFTSTTANGTYGFDRWQLVTGGTGGTTTYSTQTFTLGTAPVAGYEGSTFARLVTASFTGTNTLVQLDQKIENVRNFAGQTVTVSFWAKAASGTPKVLPYLAQGFGSGGSPSSDVFAAPTAAQTITTSWARYSFNVSIPSISGKTIGTTANTSYLSVRLLISAGSDFSTPYNTVGVQNNTFDFWGVQIESGSTATAFQTATGTIQGELAACQRYYVRYNAEAAYTQFGTATPATSGTTVYVAFPLAVPMRVAPTVLDYIASYASLRVQDGTNFTQVTGLSINNSTSNLVKLNTTVASGLTQYRPYFLISDNSTSPYIGFGAEL